MGEFDRNIVEQLRVSGILSDEEIKDLLAIVDRDINDASGPISADWRFGIAYNAALGLARRIRVRAHHSRMLRLKLRVLPSDETNSILALPGILAMNFAL